MKGPLDKRKWCSSNCALLAKKHEKNTDRRLRQPIQPIYKDPDNVVGVFTNLLEASLKEITLKLSNL